MLRVFRFSFCFIYEAKGMINSSIRKDHYNKSSELAVGGQQISDSS